MIFMWFKWWLRLWLNIAACSPFSCLNNSDRFSVTLSSEYVPGKLGCGANCADIIQECYPIDHMRGSCQWQWSPPTRTRHYCLSPCSSITWWLNAGPRALWQNLFRQWLAVYLMKGLLNTLSSVTKNRPDESALPLGKNRKLWNRPWKAILFSVDELHSI